MTTLHNCARCGFPMERSTSGGEWCARCLARSVHGLPDAGGNDATEAAPLPCGFGAYELLGEIGRGGIGVVYRARQSVLDRLVALKLLVSGTYSSEAMLSRFRQEAAAAAALHHPNIVPVFDYGECEGQPYYAMELIAGRDLAGVCDGRPLSGRRAAEIECELAAAVQYAHEMGIVHRDLKPSNVLIDEAGRARITDFGLARRLDGSSRATVTGLMLGSPSYASPEQVAGRRQEISVASDVYGLGALFYHVLTGRAPFNAATPTETLRLVLDTDPVPPRLLNPALPRDLETICLKCLAKEPAERYPSAVALAEDLERFIGQRPIHARPQSPIYRLRKFVRRHRLACGATLAVTGLAAVGLAMLVRVVRAENTAQQRRMQIEQIFARALHVADPGYSRGRDATLKDLLDDTARWVPAEFSDDPRLEAGIQARMGETYCKLSLFADAAPHLEAAWATRQRLLPEDHPDYLTSLRDLGVLRLWQQRYAEAEEHLGRVLAIQERTIGRDTEETLRTRNEMAFGRDLRLTLGVGFKESDRPELIEAHERFAREGYDLARRRWGGEHPLTLLHEWNLAIALERGTSAQLEEAGRLLARNYEVSRRVLGPEHPNTISGLTEWGRTLHLLNHNDEALKLLQECVPLAERVLGPEHADTAWAMQQLEAALRTAGRTDEACDLVPRYVSAWLRTYGPDFLRNHPFIFQHLHYLTVDCGRPEKAARVALEQLDEFRGRRHLPPDSPAIGVMLLVLADARLAQQQLSEAQQYLREATPILVKEKPTPPQLWLVHLLLGDYYRKQKEFAASEAELRIAYEGLRDRTEWDPSARRVFRWTLMSFVRLYAEWGQPGKAGEWQRDLEAADQTGAAATR